VHAASATVRTTRRATQQFGDQLPRRHTLRERVAVTSMRTEDDVALAEVGTDGGGDGFFADVRMTRSVDQSALMDFRELFFALPDDLHRAKKFKERLFVEPWSDCC
jgi:hypothetical protein